MYFWKKRSLPLFIITLSRFQLLKCSQFWKVFKKTIRLSNQLYADRSSCPEAFYEKVVLRNFAKFTGKHVYQSLFFNNVAGLRSATLLKKRLWHRRFTVNFSKLLIIPFLTEHLRWLLLYIAFSLTQCINKKLLRQKILEVILSKMKQLEDLKVFKKAIKHQASILCL